MTKFRLGIALILLLSMRMANAEELKIDPKSIMGEIGGSAVFRYGAGFKPTTSLCPQGAGILRIDGAAIVYTPSFVTLGNKISITKLDNDVRFSLGNSECEYVIYATRYLIGNPTKIGKAIKNYVNVIKDDDMNLIWSENPIPFANSIGIIFLTNNQECGYINSNVAYNDVGIYFGQGRGSADVSVDIRDLGSDEKQISFRKGDCVTIFKVTSAVTEAGKYFQRKLINQP